MRPSLVPRANYAFDCALIHATIFSPQSEVSSITTTCTFLGHYKLEENVGVNLFFSLARTEHARSRTVHCSRWCMFDMSKHLFDVGSILWRWRSHIASPLGRAITYCWQYNEEKIARRKREYTKLQLQDDTISLGPSSNSHINTETLQNKQLYSNQDAIYWEQTVPFIEKAQISTLVATPRIWGSVTCEYCFSYLIYCSPCTYCFGACVFFIKFWLNNQVNNFPWYVLNDYTILSQWLSV